MAHTFSKQMNVGLPSNAKLEQNEKKYTYKGHAGTVHCMEVYGDHLFTGSEDHLAMKFNLEVFILLLACHRYVY